jgi:cytochrome c oxidase assembly protein subunit 11
VPFYNWFCKTTGYGGTTQVAEKAPDHVLGRTLAIRFDSNVAPGLPWKFEPEQNEVKVRIGEVTTVQYKVTNEAAREVTAQAAYNVSPPQVGAYFNKINCFCFTQQTMKPGETREMAVVFYVDPSIVKDHDQDDLNTITLSYTFYRLPDSVRPVAEAPDTKSNNVN